MRVLDQGYFVIPQFELPEHADEHMVSKDAVQLLCNTVMGARYCNRDILPARGLIGQHCCTRCPATSGRQHDAACCRYKRETTRDGEGVLLQDLPQWATHGGADVAAAGDAPVHIQLNVKDQQGSKVLFKIKKSTPLRKLTDAYCSRLGLQPSQVRFTADGELIGQEDSAEKFGLEDDDVIDLAREQTMPKAIPKGCFAPHQPRHTPPMPTRKA